MISRKIMIFAIFIVSLLAVSAASAADNSTSDMAVMDDTIDDDLSVENRLSDENSESNSELIDDLQYTGKSDMFNEVNLDKNEDRELYGSRYYDSDGNFLYDDSVLDYSDAYIEPIKANLDSEIVLDLGWSGYFSGYFVIYSDDNYQVESEDIEGFNSVRSIYLSRFSEVGVYTVDLIDFEGKLAASSKITITQSAMKISVKSIKMEMGYSDYVYAYVDFKNSNYVLDEGNVEFKINGNKYKTRIYDGETKIKVKLPSKVATYKCVATFLGNKNYKTVSKSFKIQVIKPKVDLWVKSYKVKSGSKVKISFKVKTSMNCENIKKGTVKFKVFGKKYKAKIKNGVVKKTIRAPSKPGKYVCKVSLSGNKKYYGNSAKFKITVKKPVTKKITKKYSAKKTVVKKKTTKKSNMKTFKGKSKYKWKIKISTWKKMKKQAIKWYKSFRSHGSYHPGYSNGVTVKLTRNGYTYTGTAFAVKNSRGIRCEVRGLPNGYRASDWGDYYC